MYCEGVRMFVPGEFTSCSLQHITGQRTTFEGSSMYVLKH